MCNKRFFFQNDAQISITENSLLNYSFNIANTGLKNSIFVYDNVMSSIFPTLSVSDCFKLTKQDIALAQDGIDFAIPIIFYILPISNPFSM